MEQSRNFYEYEEETNLLELYLVLKRNLGIIIVVTISMALLALLFSIFLNFIKTSEPLFQAVSKIELTVSDSEKREQVMQAAADLMKGDTIVQKALEKAKINEETENVNKYIEIRRSEKANIIEICVNNEDREKAKVLAEQIREQGTSFIKNILPLDKLNVEQETVVSEDGLKSDSGINIKLNTVMGGVLGFIGIIFLILMKYTFSDKISTEEDVKKRLGLKVLVSIPNYAPDSKIKRYLSIR